MVKSESESYKCIQALLNLFMNKQAYQQIKISKPERQFDFDTQASEQTDREADEEEGNKNLETILIYLKRLKNFTDTRIEGREEVEESSRKHK